MLLNCDKVLSAIFNGRKCPCVNFTVHPFDISCYFSPPPPPPIAGFDVHGSMHIALDVPVGFCTANIKNKSVFPVMRDSKQITRSTYVRNVSSVMNTRKESLRVPDARTEANMFHARRTFFYQCFYVFLQKSIFGIFESN